MTKVVINRCFGGFGLSRQAFDHYCDLTDQDPREVGTWDIKRDDPMLVHVVELFGAKANDSYSELKVVEIPDNVVWHISDYDGMEEIHETHRIWY